MPTQGSDNEKREHPLRVLGKSLSEKDSQRSDDEATERIRQISDGEFEDKERQRDDNGHLVADADDTREDVSTTQACSSVRSDPWSESPSATDLRPEVGSPQLPKNDRALPQEARLQQRSETPSLPEELCPEGHLLYEFQTPSDSCFCDKCGITVFKGVKLYGCRQCNYDLCRHCRKTWKTSTDRRFQAMLEDVPELPSDICPATPLESVLFAGLQPLHASKKEGWRSEDSHASKKEDWRSEGSQASASSQICASSLLEPSSLIEVRISQEPERWEQARILLVNFSDGRYKVRMTNESTRWISADAARPLHIVSGDTSDRGIFADSAGPSQPLQIVSGDTSDRGIFADSAGPFEIQLSD